MKNILLASFAFTALLLSTAAMAQRARLMDGNLDMLKGVTKMNVQYEYSHMEVGKKTEDEYIADKKESLNSKEPGRGDKWEASWKADRSHRFEPRFEEAFNKYSDMQIRPGKGEKYTMIFRTVFTEPGYNVGVMRRNAYIDSEVWIVETANPGKVLAKIEITDCPGRTFMGTDYDTGERIQEAYAMAGKGLAKFFKREM